MDKIFISYSHKDRRWKDRIVKHLGVLEKEKKLVVWDDRQIAVGSDWLPEIEHAIQTCDVALLLISADFLNSPFILGQEVPKILERRLKEGIRIIPVILWACPWTQVAWLSGIQACPTDGKPLSSFSKPKAESTLAALAEEVLYLTAAIPPFSSKPPGEQEIQPDQLGHTDTKHNLEQAICLKAEAEFRIIMRRMDQSPTPEDQLAKIKENIKRDYNPKHVLTASVDIKIEHYLLPLINRLIQIEMEVRVSYRVPFSENRIACIKERIQQLIKDRWPYIVNNAYFDATEHVVHHVGRLHDYKDAELRDLRDKLLNTEPNGLFVAIDDLLQKAMADSMLLAN